MYLVIFKPFEDTSLQRNEIFNEICVIVVSYQLFIFTDLIDDLKTKEQFGYLLISSIFFNFGINIMI